MHAITIDERLLHPEEGLLLGNGDLSVSVYQDADHIIWRFGKGDVWDRRLDLSDDPRPIHIDELARGVREEGWQVSPYQGQHIEATKGSADPERMRAVCQGTPASYERRPYPCPKPVGELSLRLPPDARGFRIRQRLLIEEGRLEIDCALDAGLRLHLDCFVAPAHNVLAVRWRLDGWEGDGRTGRGHPPLWFWLYRWPDPDLRDFLTRFTAEHRASLVCARWDPKVTPLTLPACRQMDDRWVIEQAFAPEATFPRGFRYWMAPAAGPDALVEPADTGTTGEARLHLFPLNQGTEGWVTVAVPSESFSEGIAAELRAIDALLAGDEGLHRLEAATRDAARAFWAQSAFRAADPLIEEVWHETLHVRRCTYRRGAVPPGLFLPSTVQDYCHWHGDYHTNYNLQSPFWGDFAANHVELGDAFFDAMRFLFHVGRKIARDYYGCRGAFIQLSGYPLLAEDDPIGTVPMGRMGYMTGWVANHYWWRYLHTQDRAWLRETGYPAIRECALFYADFLRRGDDGLFHAFPSNQGEDGFSGDPAGLTDQPQVMTHIRYCLQCALAAAEVLETDDALRAAWRERLDHLPAIAGAESWLPPEFTAVGFGTPESGVRLAVEELADLNGVRGAWYFGQLPWMWLTALRNGAFQADRDWPNARRHLARWRHANGLIWAMSIGDYGRCGAWAEPLGVIAPLQEMALQSEGGLLRLFPAWPSAMAASFDNFRAEGAFLVSAAWRDGAVMEASLVSEAGAPCRLQSPWPAGGVRVTDSCGALIAERADPGELSFDTVAGERYRIERTP